MKAPILLATLIGTAIGIGCTRAPATRSDRTAPREYWDATGDPQIDYWNFAMRACYGRRTSPADAFDEAPMCRMRVSALRSQSTVGVDPELVAWTAAVAEWFELEADLLAVRTQFDFYPHGTRDAQAGIRPTFVEKNDQMLRDWEQRCRELRNEGMRLRETLSARYRKPFLPCVLVAVP